MRSPQTSRTLEYPNGFYQKLAGFADEVCGTVARLVAYVATLALLFILGAYLCDLLPSGASAPVKAEWGLADHSYPAFSISQIDTPYKTATYEIFRHPEGGRKDFFRWAGLDEKPFAELEIYRPGRDSGDVEATGTGIAGRIDPQSTGKPEPAGMIDTKFGPVTLLGLTNVAHSCLGFVKQFEKPALRISGWSCQGDTLPARRSAISCLLNRLMLLTSGNDPALAELFASAELKRGSCAGASTGSADWVTEADNPRLRGHF